MILCLIIKNVHRGAYLFTCIPSRMNILSNATAWANTSQTLQLSSMNIAYQSSHIYLSRNGLHTLQKMGLRYPNIQQTQCMRYQY